MAVIEIVKKSESTGEISKVTTLKSQSLRYGYSDLPGFDVNRLDVLEQLNANILQLEDLHGRLRFMFTEVQSLIKKR